MFSIERGWIDRLRGAQLPNASAKAGWSVEHAVDPAFVEPTLKVLQGDPLQTRVIVVSAPGAVGKSTYARTLGGKTSAVVVDLAKTEPLGGNFFVGGIANAFSYQVLTDAAEGRMALVVDALDEARLRSGVEGFAAGLLDLGRIVRNPSSLPAALFGRASAAEEAWIILTDAGLEPCLLEIDFFDESRALEYISRKLPIVAERRPATRTAYEKHRDSFRDLAVATRTRLLQTPGGNDIRFAGYAPVLDAICAFALAEESLNPQARAAELSALGPAALVGEIAANILKREQAKLVDQLRTEGDLLSNVDASTLYTPDEQLGRVAAALFGAPAPAVPTFRTPALREAYDRMVTEFTPQHPFLDGRDGPSNAAFAAYTLVWSTTTGYAVEEARRALFSQPGLGSGLFFELYMHWLTAKSGGGAGTSPHPLDLTDVGALYASFATQASGGQHPVLEVSGDAGDSAVEVEFEMVASEDDSGAQEPVRSYGPFECSTDSILEIRGALAGIRVLAPIAMVIGDGEAVNVTAPVEIDVDLLEIDGRELRIFQWASRDKMDVQYVAIAAADAAVSRVERIVLYGGQLSVSFPRARSHPWSEYASVAPPAPNDTIAVLRRRLRKVLTAFRSHSKGALVRLAAKIDHARMMKRDDLGPQLIQQMLADGILTKLSAGKFYQLHPDRMADALNMDYQALQQQRWTSEADAYLAQITDGVG